VVTLALVVDPEGALSEPDRSDNRLEVEVVVAPRPPPGTELAVVSVDRVAEPDRPGAIRVLVRNSGTATVVAPVVVRVDDREVARRLTGPLAPGEDAVIEVPWPPSSPVTSLAAEVSPRFRDDEREPGDNLLRRTLPVGADLRIENVSIDAPLVSDRSCARR
jgi:subtilase family serine protease